MSLARVSFSNNPTGDVRPLVQSIRSAGRGDDAQAIESLQEQADALRAALATGTTVTTLTEADIIAAGYRKTTVLSLTLTSNTAVTAAAPTTEGEWLTASLLQDGTGGWNITSWGAMFRGGPTELGVTLPGTRYLIGFQAVDISGTLTWVKLFEQLPY